MKPKPRNGFRSTLEARWAVFFEDLGVDVEYESRLFAVPGEPWYLPDFWIGQLEAYVEIKPSLTAFYDPTTEEFSKAQVVANQGERLVVLSGLPRCPYPCSMPRGWWSFRGRALNNLGEDEPPALLIRPQAWQEVWGNAEVIEACLSLNRFGKLLVEPFVPPHGYQGDPHHAGLHRAMERSYALGKP